MALIEDMNSSRYSISAYESDQITINNKVFTGSLVLSAQQIISPWPVSSVADLTAEHIQLIFNLKPEVVLLGTGDKQLFPDVEVLGLFAQQGL